MYNAYGNGNPHFPPPPIGSGAAPIHALPAGMPVGAPPYPSYPSYPPYPGQQIVGSAPMPQPGIGGAYPNGPNIQPAGIGHGVQPAVIAGGNGCHSGCGCGQKKCKTCKKERKRLKKMMKKEKKHAGHRKKSSSSSSSSSSD